MNATIESGRRTSRQESCGGHYACDAYPVEFAVHLRKRTPKWVGKIKTTYWTVFRSPSFSMPLFLAAILFSVFVLRLTSRASRGMPTPGRGLKTGKIHAPPPRRPGGSSIDSVKCSRHSKAEHTTRNSVEKSGLRQSEPTLKRQRATLNAFYFAWSHQPLLPLKLRPPCNVKAWRRMPACSLLSDRNEVGERASFDAKSLSPEIETGRAPSCIRFHIPGVLLFADRRERCRRTAAVAAAAIHSDLQRSGGSSSKTPP